MRTRTVGIVLVALVLLAVSAPAAQARSLQSPRPAVHSTDGGWLGSAVAWLGHLLGVEMPGSLSSMTAKSGTTTTTTTSGGFTIGGGMATPMTGSCIDPNGCRGGI